MSLSRMGWGAAVVLVVFSVPSWAGTDVSSAPLSPDLAVQAALSNHPDVRAAEAALLLAEGELAQAIGSNPSLSGSVLQDGPAEFELTQPLSLTGEGIHARRAAAARVDAAESWLRRTELEVAHGARASYVDAVVALRVAEVAEEGLELASRLHSAVLRLHDEGEASMLDVDLVQLARAQAAGRLLGAREAEGVLLAVLAGAVGQALTPDPLVLQLGVIAPERSEGSLDRSDVLAAQSALLAAQRELSAQRAGSVPSVGVGARVETWDGVTTAGAALTVQLPLFDRNQAGRGEANGQLRVAEARLSETRAIANTELTTTRQRDELAQETLRSIGSDPLQAAIEALASVEAGYLSGEIDLTSTVLLQAQILDGEVAVVELEGHVARARLDLLLATEDSALLGGAR